MIFVFKRGINLILISIIFLFGFVGIMIINGGRSKNVF